MIMMCHGRDSVDSTTGDSYGTVVRSPPKLPETEIWAAAKRQKRSHYEPANSEAEVDEGELIPLSKGKGGRAAN